MILHVLRHGVAEETAPGIDDGARRLTLRGRAKMRAAAKGMRAFGIGFDLLLTSPLARAAETAAIVAESYGGAPEPRELGALAHGAPEDILRALRPYARHEAVAIVGHEPALSRLASLLLTGSPEGLTLTLKKGGLVSVELGAVAPRAGTLRWLLTPRMLRRLGR